MSSAASSSLRSQSCSPLMLQKFEALNLELNAWCEEDGIDRVEKQRREIAAFRIKQAYSEKSRFDLSDLEIKLSVDIFRRIKPFFNYYILGPVAASELWRRRRPS